jgi:hypothetical protein
MAFDVDGKTRHGDTKPKILDRQVKNQSNLNGAYLNPIWWGHAPPISLG